jgi:hypothetical protein
MLCLATGRVKKIERESGSSLRLTLVLFAGSKEEGTGTVITAEALAVLSKGTDLTDQLEAKRALYQPHGFGCLFALYADGHCAASISNG